MKHLTKASACVLFSALVILGMGPNLKAQQQPGCSEATLSGTFGYTNNGSIIAGPDAGPFADKNLKIPFEYADNRDSLLVRVRFNDRPAILILDTGSAHTILRPEAVGVPRSKLIPASRSRSGAGFMGDAVSTEVTLQIGKRVWRKHHVVLMDLSDILAAYQVLVHGTPISRDSLALGPNK